MASWLNRQRKSTLQELAAEAGITDIDDLKKDEIFVLLQTKLRENKSVLSTKPALKEYYSRIDAVEASPYKRAPSGENVVPTSDNDARPPRSVRKRTKVKAETEAIDDSSYVDGVSPSTALATRTPAVQRVAARVPLPPSPAVVTDAIERQTAIIKENVEHIWTRSGVNDYIDGVRENLSSVIAVQLLTIFIEGMGLRRETLPLGYAFSIPPIPSVTTEPLAVRLPNFFELLTSKFWAATTLWTATSFGIPLLFAYFINLTLKRGSHGIKPSSRTYRADPLVFNIAKALMTFLVFAKGIRFGGLVSDSTVATVDKGLFGGYQSTLIGAAIGALVSLYEAALRK